ncbi:hypothetical protein JYK22_21720, partial [Nonomuraea sp. RK-328]|nr:hypothetical protein [Nonomuraea sp. RK-328]
LAQEFAGLHVERDLLAADLHAGNETPPVVSRAMRAPAGTSRVVAVVHDGMLIKAALYPTGKRNPTREAEVWRCMHDMAHKVREEH